MRVFTFCLKVLGPMVHSGLFEKRYFWHLDKNTRFQIGSYGWFLNDELQTKRKNANFCQYRPTISLNDGSKFNIASIKRHHWHDVELTKVKEIWNLRSTKRKWRSIHVHTTGQYRIIYKSAPFIQFKNHISPPASTLRVTHALNHREPLCWIERSSKTFFKISCQESLDFTYGNTSSWKARPVLEKLVPPISKRRFSFNN